MKFEKRDYIIFFTFIINLAVFFLDRAISLETSTVIMTYYWWIVCILYYK